MTTKAKIKFKNINEMIDFVRDLQRRSNKRLKKLIRSIEGVELKYQKEVADYNRIYGRK